jgi:hypothetical protein
MRFRWDTIQNVFYSKEEVYSMLWNIPDLSDYLVSAGKNGGPIGWSPSAWSLECADVS